MAQRHLCSTVGNEFLVEACLKLITITISLSQLVGDARMALDLHVQAMLQLVIGGGRGLQQCSSKLLL
jgi:hypothetical protein